VEAPTWLLAAAIYGGWFALTWAHGRLPWWAVLPLGGWLLAWHGSLQHEAIHGHPTRSRRVNALVAGLPLWLWLPFGLYRESHLAHHRDERITDPVEDPESFYVTPAVWSRIGPVGRGLLWIHQTLLGRLVLGPPFAVSKLLYTEAVSLARGDVSHVRYWLLHALGVGLVLGWVLGVCGIPLGEYLLLYVYPGLSLTLLRSFAEHRTDADPRRRTVVTEASPPMGLLYLHNNLHVVHHRRPGLAWYDLPARYWRDRGQYLQENGGHVYPGGYIQQLRQFAFRPKDAPVHPLLAPANRPSSTQPERAAL
jgi:fatty acid desaturase